VVPKQTICGIEESSQSKSFTGLISIIATGTIILNLETTSNSRSSPSQTSAATLIGWKFVIILADNRRAFVFTISGGVETTACEWMTNLFANRTHRIGFGTLLQRTFLNTVCDCVEATITKWKSNCLAQGTSWGIGFTTNVRTFVNAIQQGVETTASELWLLDSSKTANGLHNRTLNQ
jgi:hypothetical protein